MLNSNKVLKARGMGSVSSIIYGPHAFIINIYTGLGGLTALDLAPSFACRERRYGHMTPLSPGS